jgi:hypothetical protein
MEVAAGNGQDLAYAFEQFETQVSQAIAVQGL